MKNICTDCSTEFSTKKGLNNHIRNGCRLLRINKLFKTCPICNSKIIFTSKSKYEKAIINNSKCKKCRNIGRIITNETKDKIANTLLIKYESGDLIANTSGCHTAEARLKMSNTKRGSNLSETHKNNISLGINNSEKYKLSIKNEIRNSRISQKAIGRIFSHTHIKNLRLARINYINRCLEMNGGKSINPNFNISACHVFDKISKINDINIQHALNGGEYYLSELGYWVDGYDTKNNTVYEYDEKHHFLGSGELKTKDINRQNEIIEHLNCNFIRIKYSDVI